MTADRVEPGTPARSVARRRKFLIVGVVMIVVVPVVGLAFCAWAWFQAHGRRAHTVNGTPTLAMTTFRETICVGADPGAVFLDTHLRLVGQFRRTSVLAVTPLGARGFALGGGSTVEAFSSHDTHHFKIDLVNPLGVGIGDLSGHTNLVHALAFSERRALLASGGRDRTVRLWNVETQREVARFQVATSLVRSLDFSQDGSRLFAVLEDRVGVFDVDRSVIVFDRPIPGVWQVRALTHGREGFVFSTCHGEIGFDDRSINLSTPVDHLCLSRDGQLLGAALRDGSVALVALTQEKVVFRERGHTGECEAVAFAADEQAIFSLGDDGQVRRWPVYPWWRR